MKESDLEMEHAGIHFKSRPWRVWGDLQTILLHNQALSQNYFTQKRAKIATKVNL